MVTPEVSNTIYYLEIIQVALLGVRRMLVIVTRDGAVVSVFILNRVPDECFGRRCSRRDDTLKGNRVPVNAKSW